MYVRVCHIHSFHLGFFLFIYILTGFDVSTTSTFFLSIFPSQRENAGENLLVDDSDCLSFCIALRLFVCIWLTEGKQSESTF